MEFRELLRRCGDWTIIAIAVITTIVFIAMGRD
jgi:hypothetical protein